MQKATGKTKTALCFSNNRGLAHFVLQDTQEAILDFNLAIRLNANDYEA